MTTQSRNVPDPHTVQCDYRIGAHYFPGWKHGDHWGWNKIAPFPEREPLLGWYDEDNPEVTDWEIKWALEHGIDYFVYCWYRDKARMREPMTAAGQRYGHAIHDGLFHSRFGDRFQFAIMWECHNAGVALDERDLFENLLPFWVDTYFSRPNYLRFDGKPVLFIYSYFSLDRIAEPFGGEANLARVLERLRSEAVRRGLPDLLLPLEYRDAAADGLRRIQAAGADMAFSYCWHTPQRRPTADEAIAHQLHSLRAWEQAGILPFMATASVGWDPFPWRQPENPNTPWLHPESMTRWKLTPDDWKRLLREVKAFMDSQPATSPARRWLLLDNWNEWGEGHYLAPQVTDGFGYLDAVREVFTRCDNAPDHRLPAELGLGPYDAAYTAATAGKVVTWPMPLSEKPFPLYKLTVDGIEVPVWSGRVREAIHQPADAGWTHMFNGPTDWCGFARFDFSGSVAVAVTVDRDFNSAEILPRSAGVKCFSDGRTVHFRMDEPRPLTLLLDGQDREPLHLFTHRPETDVPSPDDPKVIYFGPGEHWVDTIRVRSGQTVYLDGGALVRAVLPPGAQGKRSGGVLKLVGYPGGPVINVSEAANVQIRGRGILDGTALPHPVRNLMCLHRCRNVRVEGIMLRNAPNWHLPIADCDDVEVDGLCGLSGRLNSDGINCVSSRHVTVRNCFMRTHDDTYAVKTTTPDRPSAHIRYERCVAWNDWGFALGVTYETRADIRDVAFADCDVIFARNWAIGVHATDGGAIEDIRFERIGVDYPRISIDPVMGRLLARIDNQKDCWSTDPGIAHVRGILLRDIDVRGQAVDRIDIQGNDPEHPIVGVRFENVRINDQPLTADQVTVNTHVQDWTIGSDNGGTAAHHD
jgi:hypothetical protein